MTTILEYPANKFWFCLILLSQIMLLKARLDHTMLQILEDVNLIFHIIPAYHVVLLQEEQLKVQGFDAKKITNGISGYLRQEFRVLNLLDEITTLRYNNHDALPTHINADLRNPLSN